MSGKIGRRYERVRPKRGPLPKLLKLPVPFYKQGHAHACERCDSFIPVCSCGTPEQDPLCTLCELGRDLSFWPESRLPRDCCRAYSRVLDGETKKRFMLAGLREWWGCSICGRKFGYDPSDKNNDPPIDMDEWRIRYEGDA